MVCPPTHVTNDFIRERARPLPASVALLVINLRKGAIQDELDQFVDLLTAGCDRLDAK